MKGFQNPITNLGDCWGWGKPSLLTFNVDTGDTVVEEGLFDREIGFECDGMVVRFPDDLLPEH